MVVCCGGGGRGGGGGGGDIPCQFFSLTFRNCIAQ